MYTANESSCLADIRERIVLLREFLRNPEPAANDLDSWFRYLDQMHRIQGNTSNNSSFVACLLAKRYLATRFELRNYDAAAKPQGAPGLDIDILLPDNKRLIGEIKTTIPYSGARGDLGAAQKTNFKKDFDKLNAAIADYKFFFVTDLSTYEIVLRRYRNLIPDVEVIHLKNLEAEG